MREHEGSQRSYSRLLAGILSVTAILLSAPAARACTAFLQGGLFAGKNYDWHLDHGLLIVNKKGIAKRAILLDPTDKAAEWVSRYGSVTFNQYGREMPNGGINTPHTGVLNPHFTDYDPDQNKWLIYYCVRHTPLLSALPEQLLDLLAHYTPSPRGADRCIFRANAENPHIEMTKPACRIG